MAKPRSSPPADTLNALGVYLRTRLKQHGRSLAALSRSTGLSRQTLHAATRAGHQRLPDLETIIRIALDLGEHPVHLIHLVLDGYQLPPRSLRRHAAREDASAFVTDVTMPDGTVVATGSRFTKTWALQNVGALTWEGRSLRCMDDTAAPPAPGPNPAKAPGQAQLRLQPVVRSIPIPTTSPGDVVHLSVDFIAPAMPCTCVSYWKSFLPDGRPCFPEALGLTCTVRVLSLAASGMGAGR